MPYSFNPPPYYGTMFFEDEASGVGWTESTWVAPGKEAVSTRADALTSLVALMDIRKQLMTQENRVTALRVGATNVRRDTLVKIIPLDAGRGSYPSGLGIQKSVPDFAALQIRLQDETNSKFAIRWLHAIPRVLTADDTNDRLFTADRNWRLSFAAYTRWHKANSYLIFKTVLALFEKGAIDTIEYRDKLRVKKVGRPFGLLRGRAVVR